MFLLDILFFTRIQENGSIWQTRSVNHHWDWKEKKRREEKFKVIKENLRKFKSLAYFQNLSFFRQNNQKISQLQMTDWVHKVIKLSERIKN